MIEITVLNYLKEHLSVPVFMEYPKNAPTEFVLLMKTGSSNVINGCLRSCAFAIRSYSDSLYNASDLNEELKTAMKEIIWENSIVECSLNTDSPSFDNEHKRYRYHALYDIKHYE